ncbi:GGDEF domain-containing protein [Pseudoalteromonas sp. S16_S37]|uniref:GGDEF domain-containing protein n=1 Tax=Pseudoalteromonas sp. S16_S37 TaxID=2720228 RepID=UPI001680B736|nr:diguanylate cyclase [Pseudoalteromonas sp. S16_S37]MBD1582131.1 diguanylate cyclase [Pseudoalteromonas sp. S16_S37]
MQQSFFKLHKSLWVILSVIIPLTILTVISNSTLKSFATIDWVDCIGEGGIAFMTLLWLVATLLSRPKGKVTLLLFFGLSALHISMLMDFLDEFYRFDSANTWLSAFEAFPAFIGMILMSFAMYFWYQEQQILNFMLLKKERFYREYGLTDLISGLYRAEYMKQQIDKELLALDHHNIAFCIALIDIKDFSAFNAKYGVTKANSLLADVGQIILLNLRDTDLVCRYASDRFIVLMPNTNLTTAKQVISQVADRVSNHKPYAQGDSISGCNDVHWLCVQAQKGEQQKGILARINEQLNTQKSAA